MNTTVPAQCAARSEKRLKKGSKVSHLPSPAFPAMPVYQLTIKIFKNEIIN
jgi:hypothetical protein